MFWSYSAPIALLCPSHSHWSRSSLQTFLLHGFVVVSEWVSPGLLTGTWMMACNYSPFEVGGYTTEKNSSPAWLHLSLSSLPGLDPSAIQSFRLSSWCFCHSWLLRSPSFPHVYQNHMKSQTGCVHMACCWDLLSHKALLTHPCVSHPHAAAAIHLFILTFNLWYS